jgi:predicted peptidase
VSSAYPVLSISPNSAEAEAWTTIRHYVQFRCPILIPLPSLDRGKFQLYRLRILNARPKGYSTDSTLTGYTLYTPKQIPADLKLPVLVWLEGGCLANGTQFLSFLNEVSSHGVFIIASCAPGGSGQTSATMMKDAIDWVVKNAGTGKYANVDVSRIAAARQSCGGVEAYEMRDNPRVTALGIFNSGQMSKSASSTGAPKITKPIFFFLGSRSDIAYANVSSLKAVAIRSRSDK